MRRFWLGFSSGFLFAIFSIGGLIPAPQPIEDKKVLLYLRRIHDNQWNVPVVASDPNGSRQGKSGDIIVFNDGGTRRWRINTSATPGIGTTWSSITN